MSKETKCSGLFIGSQMDKPMGCGEVDGGSLKTRDLTVKAHDEWTPIITWLAPAIVLPCSGNEMSVCDIFQPLNLREVTRGLTN